MTSSTAIDVSSAHLIQGSGTLDRNIMTMVWGRITKNPAEPKGAADIGKDRSVFYGEKGGNIDIKA